MTRSMGPLVAVVGMLLPIAAQNSPSTPVLSSMKDQIDRSMQILKQQPIPAYYLSYEITEIDAISISGSFGSLIQRSDERRRTLDIDLRVGTPQIDNTHAIHSPSSVAPPTRSVSIQIPLDNDPGAIRRVLWYETDRKYKRAIEQLTRIATVAQISAQAEDRAPDFSPEESEHFSEARISLDVDKKLWEDRVRRYTQPLAEYSDVYEGAATFSATSETRWFVNSEGTEVVTSQPSYQLYIRAYARLEDGTELPRTESFFASSPMRLPNDDVVLAAVRKVALDLHALRQAPVLDSYVGPAILSGRASAVFFHEVLGHRVEGSRQKGNEEAQTFRSKINEAILPSNFSIYSDPTMTNIAGQDLAGSYRFDDEGVPARRVVVVDAGVLKNFLMSRLPIDGFLRSNGHGRKRPGFEPIARQSNLIVEVSNPVSHDRLRDLLLKEIRARNKPFGLFFEDIAGGFTITRRTVPNAFNVMPVMVYRVYPDGREELVRGIDFIGTPLMTLRQIVAGDNKPQVFNGICGGESGPLPVSAISPSILVAEVELQKKARSSGRPPFLAPPRKN